MGMIYNGIKTDFKKKYTLISMDDETVLARSLKSGEIAAFYRISTHTPEDGCEYLKIKKDLYKNPKRHDEIKICFELKKTKEGLVASIVNANTKEILLKKTYSMSANLDKCMADLKDSWGKSNER
jgi:hypothetical protein